MEYVIKHSVGSYPIYIEDELLTNIDQYLSAYKQSKVILFIDENVSNHYLSKIKKILIEYEVYEIIIPAGEISKSYDKVLPLYKELLARLVTRKDLIMAIGGGVVGDLAGFVASTYLRGIDFIQVPTTLLAMIDASIGGKVAVDLPDGKNLIGSFYQPKQVLIDTTVLKTLPIEHLKDGIAEMIKMAAIGDKELFTILQSYSGIDELVTNINFLIERTIIIKKKLVEKDEFDTGERALLNYGHTLGHAIEIISDFSISHGKAIGIGMYMIENLVHSQIADVIKDILIKYGLPYSTNYSIQDLMLFLWNDKKRDGNNFKIILCKEIGVGEIVTLDKEFFICK